MSIILEAGSTLTFDDAASPLAESLRGSIVDHFHGIVFIISSWLWGGS